MKNIQKQKKGITILLADDDEEDRMLTEEALEENHISDKLFFVEDGEEAMDYLQRRGKYVDSKKYPLPELILLDLNMPKKDGREVLAEIKSDPKLKGIPVVVLTTSNAEEDIEKMYGLGVNSFITKPVTYSGMVLAMKSLKEYWMEIVSLPKR